MSITLVRVCGFSPPMTPRRKRIRQIGRLFWMRALDRSQRMTPVQQRLWAKTLTTPTWTAVYCCRLRRGLAQ